MTTQRQESQEDAEETMRYAFDLFDKDKSGSISVSEFAQVTRAMNCNPTDKEIEEFVKSLDKDQNGTLDFKEFKKFYKKYKAEHNDKEDIAKAFRMFDKDGNGFIEAKELKHILKNLGGSTTDEEIEDMIESVDTDEDGRIDYVEFTKFICKGP